MSDPITEHREWLDATYKRLLNDNSHMAGVAREACLRGIAAIAAGRAVQDDGPTDCRDGHDFRLTTDFDGEPVRCGRCKCLPRAVQDDGLPTVVWAVCYGNYEPAEVVAIYEDRADAEAEVARRNEAANTGMWEVGSFTLNRRAASPLSEVER